ncbi:MAG: DUF1847 domain-containing protein [Zoogloeaceae bacterium]|jgi:uncharacterized metal-binding protein|nr:DUF1847 domain-containing protein [Zoogloeaceae bacterium]
MPKKRETDSGCELCKTTSCHRRDKNFPSFCPTTAQDEKYLAKITARYSKTPNTRKIAEVSASVEGDYYGIATRVEETLIFIKRMGYKKIGVANCVGLIDEANIFAKAAKAKGIEVYLASCKVGSIDKTDFGLAEGVKIKPGGFEAMCNPVLQAEMLDKAGCEFNIVMGLCVGHDTLFIAHSKAPVTYLVVKDRVLGHNPAAALNWTKSYYGRLLEPGFLEPRKR